MMKIEYKCNGTYAGHKMKKGSQATVSSDVGANMVATGKAKELKPKKQKTENQDDKG